MHHWFIIIYAEKNTYQSVVIRSLSTISRFQINTLPPTPIFPPCPAFLVPGRTYFRRQHLRQCVFFVSSHHTPVPVQSYPRYLFGSLRHSRCPSDVFVPDLVVAFHTHTHRINLISFSPQSVSVSFRCRQRFVYELMTTNKSRQGVVILDNQTDPSSDTTRW